MCEGRGVFKLTQCPHLETSADAWQMIEAADWAAKGAWYMPGGWGDQTASCVDGVRFALAEKARWEAKLKEKNGR